MDQLGVFAKHWTPGAAKTRLATDVGDVVASEIHRHFVQTLLARLYGRAGRCILCYTPDEARGAFEPFAPDWTLQPQGEGDLGERMRRYFDRAFDAGCRRVVLLGSDSPNVPIASVQSAFDMLLSREMVLGPTSDGGYYLIGASNQTPHVFDHVDWSTPHVWRQTMAHVQAGGLHCAALAPWYDVDDMDDLHRLRADLDVATENSLIGLRDEIDRQLPSLK